ncbi:unnamed protein product [Calypogeia fissa]
MTLTSKHANVGEWCFDKTGTLPSDGVEWNFVELRTWMLSSGWRQRPQPRTFQAPSALQALVVVADKLGGIF